MAVRIKDWMIPYTWWVWIEITNNHVINVLLRELNNLIQVNEDNELYVDLQLPDWIEPDDDFPVWVTTWKILAEDWWQQNWIILNWKTTSWDYVRFIYANDGKLYYDPWTWIWIEIWTWGWWVQINVATASTLWLIKLGTDTQQIQAPVTATSISGRTYPVQLNADNQAVVNIPWENTTYTAWANITIDQNNVISATIPPALVYKGTVNDISDLPSSWQTIWDTYFVEWEDWMYSWDWTQWNYVWGTGIDTSNFFNKRTDTSDDIVQGLTNLFVTQNEKNIWNNKQDRISAWDGINITNNVVSNTLPFEPDNSGTMGQILQKTSAWYEWRNFPNVVTSVNGQSWVVTVDEFDPDNAGTTGQVLKKTQDGYEWQNESANSYVAGHWINVNQSTKVISNTLPFEPSNTWVVWQVIKKTPTGYQWANESGGGGWWETYYAWDWISIDSDNVIDNTWVLSVNNQTGDVSINAVPSWWTTGQVLQKTATGYDWANAAESGNVKLFTLSSTSDLTTAQEAWDWYRAWKLPILRLNTSHSYVDTWWNTITITGNFDYYLEPTSATSSTKAIFTTIHTTYDNYTNIPSSGITQQVDYVIELTLSWNNVTGITDTTHTNWNTQFISPGVGYTGYFTPTNNWHPASKKYVDDKVSWITFPVTSVNWNTWAVTVNEVPWTGTTGYVLTKQSNWYWWQSAPSSEVKVSSQSWNILTNWMKIWAWTEANYNNLGTYDNNTVYLTY